MWNFNETNFSLYRDKLNEYNYDNGFDNEDIDVISDTINQNSLETGRINIPIQQVTIQPSEKSWYNNELMNFK